MRLFAYTAQKMKFPIKNFFSKCDQIRSKLRIWSHLMKKSLMGNFIFLVILLPKEETFFNPIQVRPFRGWSRMGGGGGGAFHFVEIFRLVEINSLLHAIIMLKEKNYSQPLIFHLIISCYVFF